MNEYYLCIYGGLDSTTFEKIYGTNFPQCETESK